MALWILLTALVSALSPISASAATISILWEPSSSEDVVGYAVYYGHKSGEHSTRIDRESQTNFIIHPEAGSNYFFVVTAYTFTGLESLPSSEVAYEPNISVPKIADGTFNGLFEVISSQKSFGSFSLKMGTRNSFSGSIGLDGQQYRFSGKPDSFGVINIVVNRSQVSPLYLTLNVDSSDENRLTGTLSDGDRFMQLEANRSVFLSKTNLSPYAGKYTVAVVGISEEDLTPGGIGFASVKVLPNGIVQVKGVLGDGKNFVSSTYISEEGVWPFYASPYGRLKGLISGWLKFETNGIESIHGDLNWIKPSILRDKLYPAGFSNSVAIVGSIYNPPASLTGSALDMSNGTVTFSGGDFVQEFSKDVMLLNNKIIPVSAGADKLSFNIQKNNGLFSGTIQIPDSTARIKFRGGFLQNQNIGLGLFLGLNQTGQIFLESTP